MKLNNKRENPAAEAGFLFGAGSLLGYLQEWACYLQICRFICRYQALFAKISFLFAGFLSLFAAFTSCSPKTALPTPPKP
ncbi:hypothetical protein [Cytobacillus sp. FSL R5-0596]|uniref:hypothetical protein n=1 Tax=Cytobacillus sp. FSL R5-0596 TaxID=2954696 RepID=UPI0030FA1756